MTCWVWPQARPTFFSLYSLRFEGVCALFTSCTLKRVWYKNESNHIKPVSSKFHYRWFYPRAPGPSPGAHTESIMHDCNHNIAFAFIFYFYACWILYKRNLFLMFPGHTDLAIHNDWKGGEKIPKPSSFKSTEAHTTYGSVFQEEQEPAHLWQAGCDPLYQNTRKRETRIIWSYCISQAYILCTIAHGQLYCYSLSALCQMYNAIWMIHPN